MSDRPADPARYALCDRLLEIALRHARRLGLPPDATEDCALAFVEHALLDESEESLRPPCLRHRTGTLHVPWVTHCAVNHAIDFRRRLDRIAEREVSWPPGLWADRHEEAHVREPHDPSPGAADLLLRRAVCDTLQDGVEELDATPRALLLGHYIEERSVPELAAATNSTVPAVEQRLARARRRMRAFLERRGWTVDELRLHLASPPEARDHTTGVSETRGVSDV